VPGEHVRDAAAALDGRVQRVDRRAPDSMIIIPRGKLLAAARDDILCSAKIRSSESLIPQIPRAARRIGE
jgi:hypothetical protein